MRPNRLFWLLTGILFLQRCLAVQFNVLDLSPDEAHYWEWSKRLDWAYYSKGPLVALLIRASTFIFGDTEFGVRFPAILAESCFGILLFLYARRIIGEERALLLTLAVRLSVAFLSMGFAITTDPIVLLCWGVALIALEKIIVEGRSSGWILFGLAAGLGVLGKYTAILLPMATGLFLVIDRESRREFRSGWLYGGGLIFALALLPILIWNVQHDWVNLGHNAAHLGVQKSGGHFQIKPGYVGELIGAQLGLFGPLLWPLFVWMLFLGVREWRAGDRYSGVLSTIGLSLLGVCIAVSFTKRVYANWPMPVTITGIFLLVRLWGESSLSDRVVRWSIPLHFAFALLLHLPLFGVTAGIPGKYLTTKKLAGWQQLADEVRSNGEADFVLAENYDIASSLAFYLHRPGDVFVGNFGPRRMNQYDVWGGVEEKRGQDALIVLKEGTDVAPLRARFQELESLQSVEILYSGTPIQHFELYRGRNFSGETFPLPTAR